MTTLVDNLRQEHRDIEKLLLVLEEELRLFNLGEQPDYEILQTVISYFQEFPDTWHHPREDILFAQLKIRDPAAARIVGDLEAEHRTEAKRLQRVARALTSILANREVPRHTLDALMRDFVEHERQHMVMEEQVFFPALLAALAPEDWRAVEARVREKRADPASVDAEEKWQSVRDRILTWEQENLESRA